METENVERRPGHTQVCVWEHVTIAPDDAQDFESYMLERFNVRLQFLEEITTQPLLFEDGEYGELVGFECRTERTDILFAVHNDDLQSFVHPRLMLGVRWIEDVYWEMNYQRGNYPSRVMKYRTWDPDNMRDNSLMGLGNMVPSISGPYPAICHVWPNQDFIR